MTIWTDINKVSLQEFRPGIRSRAELGNRLAMAVMEIGPGMEDKGHRHPFEQCGIVTEGEIEMMIAGERRVLRPMDAYFIPGDVIHGWKTFGAPVKIMDVSAKQD
jgi:quercetin dioxygenase-like cupin family protein